jgi:hypothetical protein
MCTRGWWLPLVALALAGCAAGASPAPTPAEETAAAEQPAEAATPTEQAAIDPPPDAEATLLPEEAPPAGAAREFTTDFSRHSIPYSEVLSGGPPKDGIPAIDEPQFVTVDEADAWLEDMEPVLQVSIDDAATAYPIQILMWHEIVNDTVGDTPVAVTFCPLCNTGIVFERTVNDVVLDFGTTGRLRFSNLIMYDRQTETWWQQATGEAIAGDLTGTQLAFVPAEMIAWEDFKAAHPDGQVLSRETGYNRAYGENPYVGYDNVNTPPFLYDGPPTPDALPPTARVLTVDLNGEAVAYPFTVLQDEQVINDTVGGTELAVFWEAGTASALDAGTVADGADVGAAHAYERTLDGDVLTFTLDGDQIVDEQTGSTWNVQGRAIAGPLEGATLEPVVSINHFWFSWAAFKPETRIYQS